MRSPTSRYTAGLVAALLFAAGGCGGDGGAGDGPGGAAGASTAAGATGSDSPAPTGDPPPALARDACELIPAAEIEAIAGGPVTPESVSDHPNITSCNYENLDGFGYVYLTVTWSSGKQAWDIWQDVMGLTDDMWQDIEGVSLDDIQLEGAGPVPGVGDKAYYGGILPSLVLSGDVLLEMTILLSEPEVHFPVLAQSAVSRL